MTKSSMRVFHFLLGNSLVATTTNNFVWFALVFWVFLETQSVMATSLISGMFVLVTAAGGFYFGSLVDRYRKKTALLLSSALSLIFYLIGLGIYLTTPESSFESAASIRLWILITALMLGVIAGNIRMIAMPTVVTLLVAEDVRDKANGMLSTVMGVSFAITSVASGLALGFSNMRVVILLAIAFTALAIFHLLFIRVPETKLAEHHANPPKIDIKGSINAIKAVPGLFSLILFTTFNNFLGGVFMALMDAYGLSLVSVQVWGTLWGVLSFGFIAGGLYIAKYGLGENPLRTLFRINILLWFTSIIMVIQPWISLLAICIFIWICFVPFVEAIEHTIIQKVVPLERQGRVFGIAQSIEQAASPITAFLIGPLAQFFFIPFMTTGAGVELIGDWFGVGLGRGIALVFIVAGIIGLIVTLLARRSRAYEVIQNSYRHPPEGVD